MRLARTIPADELHDVYREHVGAVYAFFCYAVSRDVAEELTATTFERVVRHWRRFDPERSSQRAWILVIARNLLSDHFRRQSFRTGPSLDEHPELAEGILSSEDTAERLVRMDAVKGWLARLNPRERDVLALRYGADMSTKEIARVLELSEANVLQIASRGLRRLREELSADELTDNA